LPQIDTEPAANDGGKIAGAALTEPTKLPPSPAAAGNNPAKPIGKTITLAQQVTIRKLAVEVGVELPRLLEFYGVRDLADIGVADFLRVVRSLEKRRAA
jgi:LysM repeat protein